MSSRSRKIARGLSAGGPVVFADAGPVIISGGVPLTLVLRADDGKASISLDDHSGPSVLVAEGAVPEMSRLYAGVCRELARTDVRGRMAGVVAGAVIGALATLAAVSWIGPKLGGSVPALQASLPAAEQAPLLPNLEDLRRMAEAAGTLPPKGKEATADAAGEGGPGMTPILDLPDFLVIPGQDGGADSVVKPAEDGNPASQPTMAQPEPPASAPGPKADASPARLFPFKDGTGLPTYAAAPEASEAPEAPEAPDLKAASGLSDEAKAVADKVASDDADGMVGDRVAESAPGGGANAEEGEKAEDAPKAAQALKANDGEDAVDPISPEQAREQARLAAQSLVEKGLTTDKAKDVLAQLEALSQADLTQITPEMLAGLPHEVAQMLIEGGFVNLEDAPDGVPYRILRLPETVIAKYRGPDGIASIPEANTWASTGNFVSIPLPGGGDIRTPEDLKDFHLQP